MPDLGETHLCLKVADLGVSLEFYEKLGFHLLEDHRAENWAILSHHNLVLGLYEGHIERNLINFRGGDVAAIAKELTAQGLTFDKAPKEESNGSWSAEMQDPDGNVLFFNTYPDERETYRQTGRVTDRPE